MRLVAVLLGCGLLTAQPARAGDAFTALPAMHSGALRVYLVRHGQALSNLDPAPDLPPDQLDHLTELGTRQAEAVGRALAGRGVSFVFTSPASRARETASVVARTLGIEPPGVEQRLRPMALGRAPRPELGNGSITVVDVAATGAVTIRLANYLPPAP